jgi:flagellar FliJ protein
MKWAQSLIRISNFEVEELQKRLAQVVERRSAVEIKLAVLEAEAEAELLSAQANAEAGWYMAGFREGVKVRRQKLNDELAVIMVEEEGARDALTEAFEALKKYEQVDANAKDAARKEAAKRETAALDELGLRRASRH